MSGAGQLRIDSPTGVEVALPVAGAGGRAFAFLVDWHIRVALALAWYGAGALLHSYATRGAPTLAAPFDPGVGWFLAVIAPTALLYFAYHPLLEVLLRGRTPGKRYAGLRIVMRDGRTPGPGALLVRNVFRLVDSFPGLYCVGLVATLLTRQAVRIGDLAAGTVLVYERAAGARALPWAAAALAPPRFAGVELAAELDARWSELAPQTRTGLARELLRRLGAPPSELAAADDSALRRQLAAQCAPEGAA